MLSMSNLLQQQCSCNLGTLLQGRRKSSKWKPLTMATLASPSQSLPAPSGDSIDPTVNELLVRLEIPKTKQNSASKLPRTYTIKDEELVPGKIMTGRVKSIMRFGAFVDLGARIDGLIHISKLAPCFVQNVEDFVKIGEQVQVEILDVDLQNQRVSLKRCFDSSTGFQGRMSGVNRQTSPGRQTSSNSPGRSTSETIVNIETAIETPTDRQTRAVSPNGTDRQTRAVSPNGTDRQTRAVSPNGRQTSTSNRQQKVVEQKTSYKKGQRVTGVVKNLTQKGCFVQLPGNVEGFLHANEINEPVPIEKLVKVGQEVKVKVLRVVEGRLNLSMKEDMAVESINEALNENVAEATNAFVIAFRRNPIIRSYLRDTGRLGRLKQNSNKEEEEASTCLESDNEATS